MPADKGITAAVFVAQFFPPFNSVASQRALRIARVLLSRFQRVYVVTLPPERLPPELIDHTLASDELADQRLRVIKVQPLLRGYGIVAKPGFLQRVIGATLTRLLCSSGGDWVPPLSAALARIDAEADVRLVISTGGPFAPFVPVLRFAKRRRAKTIIDYRDLWTQNPRAPYPALSRWLVRNTLERSVNQRCDVVTTVSHGCRISLESTRKSLKVRVLMNTPDESYASWFATQMAAGTADFSPEFFNIVLAGTVYDECTCRMLLEALKALPAEQRARARVHYLGLSADNVRMEFSGQGLEALLVQHGFVKKDRAAALVKGADALLSLVYDGVAGPADSAVLGLMTTKVFDYFLSGRPVINVGPKEADVCVLARQMGYAEFHTFEAGEESSLTDFLSVALVDLTAFRRRSSVARLPDFAEEFGKILTDVQAR